MVSFRPRQCFRWTRAPERTGGGQAFGDGNQLRSRWATATHRSPGLLRGTQQGTYPFHSSAALSWPRTFPGDRPERMMRQSPASAQGYMLCLHGAGALGDSVLPSTLVCEFGASSGHPVTCTGDFYVHQPFASHHLLQL